MRRPLVRLLALAAALVLAGAVVGCVHGADPAATVGPASTASPAASPACANVPGGGPAGVDLHGACVTNEVVSGLTRPGSGSLDAGQFFGIFAFAFAAAVALVWTADFFVRRYEHVVAATPPAAWWACPACHSFNGEDAAACYGCRAARPPGARLVPGARPEG